MAYAFLVGFFKGGTLPEKSYLINLGLILTVVLQITSALVYQLLSMATSNSKNFSGDLTDSLSFKTCFVYYSIFLILKMINPMMYPIHWLILIGKECCVCVCVCVCCVCVCVCMSASVHESMYVCASISTSVSLYRYMQFCVYVHVTCYTLASYNTV